MTDLADTVEELYGLPRDGFIPRRDELVKQARAEKDRETATAIGALRKPSVAAWLANQLAREHPDEVGALAELGSSLRDAQSRLEGDALRQLSRQRRGLVQALVDRARTLARADGVRIGDAATRELEQTIQAALADGEVARALAAGHLVTAIEPGAGLGDAAASSAITPTRAPRPRVRRPGSGGAPPSPSPTPTAAPDTEHGRPDPDTGGTAEDREAARRATEEAERAQAAWDERRRQLRDERDDAEDAAHRAREAARAADRDRDDAERAAGRARATVEDLRARLGEAEDEERAADDRSARAEDAHEQRRRAAEEAAERRDDADRRLAEHEASAPETAAV